VSNLVLVEVSFAVSAGVLTALSPCGVPFLPSLVSLYLADDGGRLRGGPGGAAFTLGLLTFLIPLAILAILLSALLRQYTAFLVLGGGIAILLLAGASLLGRPLLYLPGIRLASTSRGYGGLFVMGVTYVAASVGCTPALLFGVAASAVATGSLASSSIVLLAFIVSVAVPTLLLSLLAAEYRETYRERIRRLMGPIKRASTVLTVGMGAYLILFYILFRLGWVTIA
jgi:cytochrome c biogenesis protein CcdA